MKENNLGCLKAIVGLFGLALWMYQIIAIYLKLTETVSWSWFWVLFPTFAQMVLVFLAVVIMIVIIFFLWLRKRSITKKFAKIQEIKEEEEEE